MWHFCPDRRALDFRTYAAAAAQAVVTRGFPRGGAEPGNGGNSGGDQDAAELGEHVARRRARYWRRTRAGLHVDRRCRRGSWPWRAYHTTTMVETRTEQPGARGTPARRRDSRAARPGPPRLKINISRTAQATASGTPKGEARLHLPAGSRFGHARITVPMKGSARLPKVQA
jgi:hypothetical protein